ncbi:MAG: NAD-binding protein [Verrucomicrobiales bacterium]|nr:NAD-binding protein [Verrucomicrobiales bacterium]
MKALTSVLTAFLENKTSRQNLMALLRLLVMMVLIVTAFSVLFHIIMEREGQHHSWVTGFYWTLTVMSTLGFGDITFESDLGRAFSIVVLVTGVVVLLVLLPFTFIEFFYAPWIRAQKEARAPRELPVSMERHVILTQHGPVTRLLVQMLKKQHYPYVVLVPAVSEALELHENNVPVVVGEYGDPDTYRKLRIEQAAMVVTTRSDIVNTNVTFSVREISEKIPIISSARSNAARDALELCGVTHILQLEDMMGQALSRRVVGGDSCAHVIGSMGELVIAEAAAAGTDLVGKTVAESDIKKVTGITLVGFWNHGKLVPVTYESRIGQHTIFVFGGTREQIDAYNETFGHKSDEKNSVVIVGGGRVGRATGQALEKKGIPWTIIEKLAERVQFPENTIVGDGSEFDLLVKAGLHEASTVIITTHDDDTNLFLTIFYRRLRKSLQIISRCSSEHNVERLHRAGADVVLSYATMSANTILNHLRGSETLLLAEGVSIFTSKTPVVLSGRTLQETHLRSKTGCSVIATDFEGNRLINPPPDTVLQEGGELVLIGSLQAEEKFFQVYPL